MERIRSQAELDMKEAILEMVESIAVGQPTPYLLQLAKQFKAEVDEAYADMAKCNDDAGDAP